GFGFLEAILIIATAMVFMKSVEATGALGTLSYYMVKWFHRSPSLLVILIVVFVMFPGMLTGLSSACILTTGALVAPGLIAMGMSRRATGALIAMAAVFGEVAPPICIPVMLIGGGVDMPYIGFTKPLFLASFPLAIATALYFRFRYLDGFKVEEVLPKLRQPVYALHGMKLFLPLVLVVGFLVIDQAAPNLLPHLGVPLIFLIGAVITIPSGEKYNVWRILTSAVRGALPIMAILVGVGMFLQILTLTGVRGFLAVNALLLPEEIRYLAAAIMPFFGSAYASASVIGVPLVFVFIGKNAIVVTAALALLAAMGDLMPPPSLLCAYAAQIVGEKNHFNILRQALVPIVASLIVGLSIIYFADDIAAVFF
ncbi:MAG: TRAP transporter large permease subunit, partial [Bacteroidetes bacterium]|nr:TRAP transporter large permease subunit [Bacteroidota bacterium]